MKIYHSRNTRLYVNAGMEIPDCKASAKMLDVEKRYRFATRFPDTHPIEVNCKRCIKLSKDNRK